MGSEMCIRDRVAVRGAGRHRRLGRRRLHDHARRRVAPRGPTGTCLLYTSDAADERSSVDLGGRRIIKKKKKIKERGVTHCVNEIARRTRSTGLEAKKHATRRQMKEER